MLYKYREFDLDEVKYVIFDEAQYLNDQERGYVWEEILIMLPKNVQIILLSATISNYIEVAEWIGSIRKQNINVIVTYKRPVPLQHILYYDSGRSLNYDPVIMIDIDGNFKDSNFKIMQDIIDENFSEEKQKILSIKQNMIKLIEHLKIRKRLPCIVFIFSIKLCDDIAKYLSGHRFTAVGEEHIIGELFDKYISKIDVKDRGLPQIGRHREMCIRGISVHHSGILPILREITELLFKKEFIKVLIVTETFALGVNMPAKSVAFLSLSKFDGQQNRNLFSSEYIQMAGRAGRRGIDEIGYVYIIASQELLSKSEFKEIISGQSPDIKSKFRLTYGMIINLLGSSKDEDSQNIVESIIKLSFSEFMQSRNSPLIIDKIDKLERELLKVKSTDLNCYMCKYDIEIFFNNFREYMEALNKIIFVSLTTKKHIKHFYCEGRVIFINVGDGLDCRAAIIIEGPRVNFKQKNRKYSEIYIKVLFRVDNKDSNIDELIQPIDHAFGIFSKSYDTNYSKVYVADIPLSRVIIFTEELVHVNTRSIKNCLTNKIIQVLILKDLTEGNTIKNTIDNISLTLTKNSLFKQKYLTIQHLNHTNTNELSQINSHYMKCISTISKSYNCLDCTQFEQHSSLMISKYKLEDEIKIQHKKLSDFNLTLVLDYFKRVQVLKDLTIIDDCNKLTSRGKVSIKFSNNFEIVLTLLLFNTSLFLISPQYLTCLLSCFSQQRFSFKDTNYKPLRYGLQNIWEDVTKILRQIDQIESKNQLSTSERHVYPNLMEAMYEWCQGSSFENIALTANMSEGNLVRNILRINELCQELEKAADQMGNLDLITCVQESRKLIKRDIVNISSLYLFEDV